MPSHGITIGKITLTVSPEQSAWLNEVAEKRSTSVSDILRRLIDETRGAYLTPRRRAALRASLDNATG